MWMKIDFAYEKMSTKTRFEKEAWGNSEMVNFGNVLIISHVSKFVLLETWKILQEFYFSDDMKPLYETNRQYNYSDLLW